MAVLRTDVAVIGAGTAGMSAWRAARARTDRVLLIETGPYGTTCARVGCMPSKLLIAAADVAHAVAVAPLFGIEAGPPRIDGAAVMRRVRAERDRFVRFVVDAVESWPDDLRLRGRARFLDAGTLAVTADDGSTTRVEAGRIVIATGSRPSVPDGWRAALGDRLLTSDDLFEQAALPASVAVAGTGVIGLEVAQALSRLGVRVRVFGRGGRIGPATDPALQAVARTVFGAALPLEPEARSLAVARDGDGVAVRWTDAAGEARHERFDRLLAATGRRPNVDDLGLDATGLPLDGDGVPVHDRLTGRIGDSTVFLAGDAAAERPLLHEAADDGRIAGDNAGRCPDVRARPRRTPLRVAFTDPQIALAGATRAELVATGTPFATGRVSFEDQGRSRVMGRNQGLLHVYGSPLDGRLLGAEMIGPAAEHLGHLLSWSVQRGDTVQAMLDSPFYHPVVEEGLRTALRDLRRALGMGPPPEDRCLDCGPGG